MKRTAHLLLIALLLAACGGWRGGDRLMSRADSLMYARPEAALALLDSIPEADRARMSKDQRMRYELLRLSAQNKCDTLFRSDSLQLMLTEYYDHHGTANERMTAYYLLGRAYADMGEAPAALQAYQKAAEAADTESKDIDYHQLSIIHGQTGLLYQKQNLARYDIEELSQASRYALMDGDTLSSVLYEELKASEYYMLGEKDSCLMIREKAARFFEEKDENTLAAIIRGQCALNYIEHGDLDKAAEYLRNYEMQSGHIGHEGEALPGREIYYFWKGKFHEASDQTDSAITYYRKLMDKATSFNDKNAAADGLYRLFSSLGIKDSTVKYAVLSTQLGDSVYSRSTADMLQRLQAEFNYSRNQRMADQRKLEIEAGRRSTLMVLLICGVIAAFTLYLLYLYRRMLRLKESEILAIKVANEQDRKDLAITRCKLQTLMKQKESLNLEVERYMQEKDSAALEKSKWRSELGQKRRETAHLEREIAEKDALVTLLERRVKEYEQRYSTIDIAEDKSANRFQTPIFDRFRYLVYHPLTKPTAKEWLQLEKMMEEYMPAVKLNLKEKFRIKEDDYHICLLILLSFAPGEIATIMDVSNDLIAKKRKRLHKKIFREEGSPSDLDLKLRALF